VLADANEHSGSFRVLPKRLAELILLVEQGRVSHQAGKRILIEMAVEDGLAAATAERLGLVQVVNADQLSGWVDIVIERHPEEVGRFRRGDGKLLGFLIGAVMKQSEGRADPKRVQSILMEKLKGPVVR
jgi:Asp-tRNA(Asn)/Glu-tRNA(Gln) amidotransferase B subunit